MELTAIEFCKNHHNTLFYYQGSDAYYHGSFGHVEILEDMNCCAPTNTVLFAFVCPTKRKVMDAKEFISFTHDLIIVSR